VAKGPDTRISPFVPFDLPEEPSPSRAIPGRDSELETGAPLVNTAAHQYLVRSGHRPRLAGIGDKTPWCA